jgi:hypothetical protein
MAQLNSLLVTGNSRFLNPINGNARNGVYYVRGTQTATTGSWTGSIPIPALYDGLTIIYYLPYAGSGNATLNLTLSNGTTTGARPCYFTYGARLTTHYAKGTNIVMIYHPAGSISVDGTATTEDRWLAIGDYYQANTDQNAMYVRYYNNVKAKTALTAEKIIVGDADGYSVIASGVTFDLSYPILWTTAAVSQGASNYANMYIQTYDRNLTNVKSSFSGTANKGVYLIVTISGNTATVDANLITDTLPSTADGKVYIRLGKLGNQTTGANYFFFEPVHPMVRYVNGAIRDFIPDADTVNGLTVQTAVPSGAVFTDTKVAQTIDNSTSSDFRVLFSNTADDTTRTEGSKKSANFKYNPSGQKLTVTNIDARSIVTGGVTAEGITSSGSLSGTSLSLGSGAITCGAVNGSSGTFSSAVFSLLLGLAYTDSLDVSHTIPLVNANPADGSIVIQSAFEQAIKDLNKWTLIDSVSGVLSDTTDKSVAIPSATLNACREILVITDLQLSNTVDQTFTRVIPYDEITATSPLGLGSTARRYLDSYMYSTNYFATLAYTVSSSAVTYDKNWSVVKNGSATTTGYKFQIKVYWR